MTRRQFSLLVCGTLFALSLGAGFAFRGCHDGPFGRFQARALNAEQENKIGTLVYADILEQCEVVKDGPEVDTMRRVGRRLADATSRKDVRQALKLRPEKIHWEFSLIQEDEINAFCFPGGKVIVFTGMLPVAETEAGLAAVLGHELGHALAHHAAERLAQRMFVGLSQVLVSERLGGNDEDRRSTMAALGAGTQVGVNLPFDRAHEAEADRIGLILMAAAGYDPRVAIGLWERTGKRLKAYKQPEYMSTHPSDENRARAIEGWLPDVLPLYEKSQKQDGSKLLPLSAKN